jgi:hypothetical protein
VHRASPRPEPPGARRSVHTAVRSQEFKWALEIKQSSKLCTRYRYASVPPLVSTWLGLGSGLEFKVRVVVRVGVSGEG